MSTAVDNVDTESLQFMQVQQEVGYIFKRLQLIKIPLSILINKTSMHLLNYRVFSWRLLSRV